MENEKVKLYKFVVQFTIYFIWVNEYIIKTDNEYEYNYQFKSAPQNLPNPVQIHLLIAKAFSHWNRIILLHHILVNKIVIINSKCEIFDFNSIMT